MNSRVILTKNILTSLKDKKLDMTPENYFKEFKKQAKITNLYAEEIEFFNEIAQSLTKSELESLLDPESLNNLLKVLSNRATEEELKELLIIMNDILSPSIDFRDIKTIENFIKNLIPFPKKILTKDSLRTLQNLTNNRIENDRVALRKKAEDIIKITSLMEKYFLKSLLQSSNSSKEINKIKDELNELKVSEFSFREIGILQSKLINTVHDIENTLEENYEMISNHKSHINEMQQTIEKLQSDLSVAKEEKSLDFLTNILNRRAYEDEVIKIEKKHNIFGSNYAMIFIDIDYFKNINDTYGHKCGDKILQTFSTILKKLTRKEDVLCRYGGEEFITLLNYRDEDEIISYVNRLKRIIKNNSFVCDENKISLRFCAGVAFRKNYDNYESMKIKSDKLLYKAKNEGRDKVVFDNGTTI